jgi:hypothetical protein
MDRLGGLIRFWTATERPVLAGTGFFMRRVRASPAFR